MSKWEKLIQEILSGKRDLRFDDLAKALIKMGYEQNQPKKREQSLYFQKARVYAYYNSQAYAVE